MGVTIFKSEERYIQLISYFTETGQVKELRRCRMKARETKGRRKVEPRGKEFFMNRT